MPEITRITSVCTALESGTSGFWNISRFMFATSAAAASTTATPATSPV
jgi:hypothetical protein